MSYEDQIAALVDTHLAQHANSSSMWPLLDALGCKYVDWTAHGYLLLNPKQPDAAHDRFIARTLISGITSRFSADVFRAHENFFSMIQGLCTNQRWAYCLEDENDAHTLVAALAEFCVFNPSSKAGEALMSIVECEVCNLLNEWLRPTIRFVEVPQAYTLAVAIFGSAWGSVALSDAEGDALTISKVILAQRPPFLPRLVPAQDNVVAMKLPSIDTATKCG